MSGYKQPMNSLPDGVCPPTLSCDHDGWLWDVFCRVIDNHGDLGVCWRLSVDLAERGHRVRLWVDDSRALRWMAPEGHPRVQVLPWSENPLAGWHCAPGDVTVEAFGCELPQPYQQALAEAPALSTAQPAPRRVWINLEYLSAEPFVERLHGLPSPVLHGPAQGLSKWFFFPGFTPRTGGLIRERSRPELAAPMPSYPAPGPHQPWRMSLFCYEPASLGPWLHDLQTSLKTSSLWVTAGRATAAVQQHLGGAPPATTNHHRHRSLQVVYLPYLSQVGYDRLLRSCHLNWVRGEDSLVRAIWAGRPFVWQLYPQQDQAHLDKLEAFLAFAQPPARLAQTFRAWNDDHPSALPALTPALMADWQAWAQDLKQRLCAQEDLSTQLVKFVAAKR